MNTTLAASAASQGVVGALVVVIVYVLEATAHITVPAEVSAALMVVIAPFAHLFAQKMGMTDTATKPTAPVTPPAAP